MAKKKKHKKKSVGTMKQFNGRLTFVKFLMLGCIIYLIGRIGYFKFVKGEEFEKEVRMSMMSTEREVEALRGTIVDRNNKTVAASTLSYHIILDPKILLEEVKEGPRKKTYEVLAEYSGKTVAEIEKLVKDYKDTHYKIFMRDIPAEDMTKLKEKNIQGVHFEESFVRNYPKGSLAAQAIGFYSKKGEGQYGVEQAYNQYLLGKRGRIFSRMQPSSIVTTEVSEAQSGHTVVLTIDEVIQQYVEQTMNKYVKELAPLNAAALVMNPKTGEIYAMYSYPYYDPNHYTDLSEQMGKEKWDKLSSEDQALALNRAWKNFNTQNPYEPGSTFKPLLVAAALEEGYIKPDTLYNCTGSNQVGPETIKCWKRGGHGLQTLEQALANSCNSAMIEISKDIPTEAFYDYFIRFGFNDITQIDLPGETTGLIHDLNRLGPVQKATSSMGQSFTITPIQLITAFSALINGGHLMQPYIVSSVVDAQNNIIMQNTPKVKRQIFSEEVALEVSQYMEAVVRYGTGAPAAVAGYTVGGKTGTAEKLPRGQDKYILSFMGYAPVEDPQVVALILFDEIPEDTKAQSMAFKEIMQNVLPYLGIEPTEKSDTPVGNMAVVPSIIDLDITDGITRLETEKLNYEVIGVGNKIVNQYPEAGTKLPYENTVKIYLEAENPEKIVQVPDLIGLSLEDAQKATSDLFTLEGYTDEKINHQIPKPGTKIEKGHKIIVQTVQ